MTGFHSKASDTWVQGGTTVKILEHFQSFFYVTVFLFMRGSRGRRGAEGGGRGLKNHKNIEFLSNTGPDPLKNYKATKPACNVGPTSARQRNAIEMVFRWRADDGPLIAVFGSFLPSSAKNEKRRKKTIICQNLTPSGKPFWIRTCSLLRHSKIFGFIVSCNETLHKLGILNTS